MHRRHASRMLAAAGLAALLLAAPVPGRTTASAGYDYPFQNPNLALRARVDDLASRLTIDEKISLLHQYQPAIPRLGIKPFKAGTEALHGLAWSNDYNHNGNVVTATATTFPQAVGLASTWDPALVKRVGSAVGDEARGYNRINPTVWSLNLWAPVVNLLRDPRWGRNEEGYSEDPYLTGAIATAYGSGMEGNDPRYLKTAPTLKHYLAYNNEVNRVVSNSIVPPRVLQEYDRQAFKPPIAANAATGVMTSYNLVNGRPNTVSPDLNDLVRTWTDTPLFNVSDAGAPANLTHSQHYFATQAEADAAAIKAGLNSFSQGGTNATSTLDAIRTALTKGLVTQQDIDTAVRQSLTLRFRLGEFDPDGGPYAKIAPDVINSAPNRQLARQAADEAMVLLKNSGGALPLDPARTKKVAVVGPLEKTLYSDWYGGALPYRVTPLQGVTERLGSGATVADSEAADRIALKDVATGKYVTAGSGSSGAPLAERATTADRTTQFDVFDWGQGVLTLRSVANGEYLGYEAPNFVNDQDQPNGWSVQQQFKLERRTDGNYALRYAGYDASSAHPSYLTVQSDGTLMLGAATADAATPFARSVVVQGQDAAVAAAKGADAAVVVVGSMPFINGREDHDRTTMALAAGQEALIKAVYAANPHTIVVLENSYPDTITWEQGNVPAILWTTHAGQETGHAIADVLFGDVNPAGRLTQTWYRSDADLPDILNYDIISSDRTYQYFTGTPLYPMGYGLSYTSFRYSNLRLSSPAVDEHGRVTVSIDVTNTGTRAGDEVVQLYTHAQRSRVKQPLKQLRGFQRVHLAAGERRTVCMTLNASDLAFWDVTRERWVVESGGYDVMVGSSSADIRASTALRVLGEVVPPRNLAQTTRGENFDAYQATTLVDESKARGTATASTGDGAWLKYADVGLCGPASFTARVAATATGRIDVRLDDPVKGQLLGTANVPSTGDVYSYTTVTAPLARVSGQHDVYLVFTGQVRLATFAMT